MPAFEPLRAGFRELNRLLIDSQQWDARHEARQAEQELQRTQYLHGLEQQAFQNHMKMAAHELALRGEDRLAEATAQNILESQHRMDMANKRYGLDVNQDARAASKLEMEREAHRQDMIQQKAKTDEILYQTEPVALSFSGMLPQRFMENNEFMTALNESIAAPEGFVVNPDGSAALVDGEPVMIKRNIIAREYAPRVRALMSAYDDTPQVMENQLETMTKQYDDLKKVAAQKSPYRRHEAAAAKKQMASLEPQMMEAAQQLSPAGMLDYHRNKADELSQYALWLESMGDSELANRVASGITHHQTAIRSIEDDLRAAGETTEAKRPAMFQAWQKDIGEDGRSVPAGKWSYDWTNLEAPWVEMSSGQRYKQLPTNITFDEPYETISKEGVGEGPAVLPGTLTEKEMLKFPQFGKEDQLGKLFYPDALKPTVQTLRQVTNSIFKNRFNENPARRKDANLEAQRLVTTMAGRYFNNVDEIRAMDSDLIKAAYIGYVDAGQIKPKSKRPSLKDMKQAIIDKEYRDYAKAMKKIAGNPRINVARPNKHLRGVLEGLSVQETYSGIQ